MAHNLLFVTVELDEGDEPTSLTARKRVYDALMRDPTFIGGASGEDIYYFTSPIADYFLIGGAWSGYLIGEERSNNWDDLGRKCDGQLITQELYDRHLKPFEGDAVSGEEFLDLDFEEVEPDFIGRKWLVVVDFHS